MTWSSHPCWLLTSSSQTLSAAPSTTIYAPCPLEFHCVSTVDFCVSPDLCSPMVDHCLDKIISCPRLHASWLCFYIQGFPCPDSSPIHTSLKMSLHLNATSRSCRTEAATLSQRLLRNPLGPTVGGLTYDLKASRVIISRSEPNVGLRKISNLLQVIRRIIF